MNTTNQPQLKLYYFDAEGGAGDPIRNAFKIANIPFEDIRIPFSEWPNARKLESRFIYQQIPILEIDGVPHAQSNPILRYVGKLCGLYPTNPVHALRADEIMDCFMELRGKLSVTRVLPKDMRLSAREHIINKFLIPYYAKIERRIAANETEYSVGNTLTIADLVLYNDVTSPFYGAENLNLQQHPAIMRVVNIVKVTIENSNSQRSTSKL